MCKVDVQGAQSELHHAKSVIIGFQIPKNPNPKPKANATAQAQESGVYDRLVDSTKVSYAECIQHVGTITFTISRQLICLVFPKIGMPVNMLNVSMGCFHDTFVCCFSSGWVVGVGPHIINVILYYVPER